MARSVKSNTTPETLDGSIVYFAIDTTPGAYRPIRGPYMAKPPVSKHRKHTTVIEKYKLTKVIEEPKQIVYEL